MVNGRQLHHVSRERGAEVVDLFPRFGDLGSGIRRRRRRRRRRLKRVLPGYPYLTNDNANVHY